MGVITEEEELRELVKILRVKDEAHAQERAAAALLAEAERELKEAEAKLRDKAKGRRAEWAKTQSVLKRVAQAENRIMSGYVDAALRNGRDKAASTAARARRAANSAAHDADRLRAHLERRKKPEYAMRQGKRVKVRGKADQDELDSLRIDLDKAEALAAQLDAQAKLDERAAATAQKAVDEAYAAAVRRGS